MDYESELLLASLGEIPYETAATQAVKEYSDKIAKAIQPLTPLTAPIVAVVLRGYADAVKRLSNTKEMTDVDESVVEIRDNKVTRFFPGRKHLMANEESEEK